MKTILLMTLCFIALTMSLASNAKGAARCTGRQLRLIEGAGDADMGGKRYGSFIFENVSKRPCSLRGFPRFAALDRRGRLMTNVKIAYSNDYPGGQDANTKTVTLAPGEKGWFQIFYNDGMALDHKSPFPKVSKVRVLLAGDTKTFVLASEFIACCGIQVGSFRSGAPATTN